MKTWDLILDEKPSEQVRQQTLRAAEGLLQLRRPVSVSIWRRGFVLSGGLTALALASWIFMEKWRTGGPEARFQAALEPSPVESPEMLDNMEMLDHMELLSDYDVILQWDGKDV